MANTLKLGKKALGGIANFLEREAGIESKEAFKIAQHFESKGLQKGEIGDFIKGMRSKISGNGTLLDNRFEGMLDYSSSSMEKGLGNYLYNDARGAVSKRATAQAQARAAQARAQAQAEAKANENLSAAVSGAGQTEQAKAAEAGRAQQAQARAVRDAEKAKAEEAARAKNKAESDEEWLDNGYNAEKELEGMGKGYKENGTPKASSRNMGATDEDLAAGGDKAAQKRVARKRRQAKRTAARERANKEGSENSKPWYDDDESRAFAQSQADEEYQRLGVDWSNKKADINEKIAKAKMQGNEDLVDKLREERKTAYMDYRKGREKLFEKNSKGDVIYQYGEDGKRTISRKADPGVLDWVRGHGYDKAGAGIGA